MSRVSEGVIAPDIPFSKRSFDVRETAAILHVSESTVFELLKGPLRSFKAGRARRITGQAIDDFRAPQTLAR